MQTNRQKLPADFEIIMNKLNRSTLKRWSIGTLIFSIMLLPLAFSSCHKPDPEPIPAVKKLDESVTLQNKSELAYTATLSNVNSAKLVVNKDGALVFSVEISDVAASGPDYQMTFKYNKDDPTFKNFTKGKYEFILTSDDFASDKLEKRTSIEIPNYLPTVNLAMLDLKQLNFMECFDATLPIDTNLYKVFSDDNPEDNPVSVTEVKSIDGKTTPTITTTSTGYDLNVKAVTGNTGAYQLELDFGSVAGGLEKTILSGTIGIDTRIKLYPATYTDDPNAIYNSFTSRTDMDNYLLEKLLQNPGNTVPYSKTKYTCTMYDLQLFIDTEKKFNQNIRTPSTDFGKTWLYNNSTATSIDSIYANGGTWANAGTIEIPILQVTLKDDSHSPASDPLRHSMNATLPGRDLSTGKYWTNFFNYDFIEPQSDAINVQPGQYLLPRDCDEVRIGQYRVVEDPIYGNYLESVTLATFRIDNGVPTLTYENTDPKYNIIVP
jgi:hypothetical protein